MPANGSITLCPDLVKKDIKLEIIVGENVAGCSSEFNLKREVISCSSLISDLRALKTNQLLVNLVHSFPVNSFNLLAVLKAPSSGSKIIASALAIFPSG